MEKLSKEKLESWYIPKNLGSSQGLTEVEEEVAEDECEHCHKVDCMCYEDAIEHEIEANNLN